MAATTKKIYNSESYLLKIQPLWHKEITPTRHMYLQRFKGKIYLQCRDFLIDHDDVSLFPSARGFSLNKQGAADLLAEMATLREI